jgi:hypothetical protein
LKSETVGAVDPGDWGWTFSWSRQSNVEVTAPDSVTEQVPPEPLLGELPPPPPLDEVFDDGLLEQAARTSRPDRSEARVFIV